MIAKILEGCVAAAQEKWFASEPQAAIDPLLADGFINGNEFITQYHAWLDNIGIDGPDANTSITGNWYQNDYVDSLVALEDWNANGPVLSYQVKDGATFHDRFFEVVLTQGEGAGIPVITASDGNDITAQWHSNKKNMDVIELNSLTGLRASQRDTLFDLTCTDTNANGTRDAVLTSDGGSITILDSGTHWADELAFFHDPQVDLL
ncbi:MAG: hypothetical protein EXR05_09215 [Acetobacteraceae bacterium]|nr:hypothetical protein [Acetobacteraceae bacterium]MSP29370.1 hypothetical protein [Acetobacteraceae bacterium]